jgi:hypothetical protein
VTDEGQVLQRSAANSPLDCRLDLRGVARGVDDRNETKYRSGLQTVEFVTGVFTSIADRVHALLILDGSLYDVDIVRSRQLRLAFPNLRHLATNGPDFYSASGPSQLPDFLVRPGGLKIVRLTSLHLSRGMMSWDVLSILVGLDSVSFPNYSISPDKMMHILWRNAASLRIFRAGVLLSSGAILRKRERLHLPRLKRLEIFCPSWRVLSESLSLLDLLAQTELHLSIFDEQYIDDGVGLLQAFRDHAQRSACTVWTVEWGVRTLSVCARQCVPDRRPVLSLRVARHRNPCKRMHPVPWSGRTVPTTAPSRKQGVRPRFLKGELDISVEFMDDMLFALEQLLDVAEELELNVVQLNASLCDPIALLSFLRRCARLAHLTLTGEHWVASLLPHLLPDIVDGDGDAQPPMPMPNLQSIRKGGGGYIALCSHVAVWLPPCLHRPM